MGLMIHSLGEIPADAQRGYFVYLLDYGWDEPLGEVLFKNFDRMADQASRNNSVVLRGLVGSHFVDEVLSWHQVNGQPADKILPAILVTTRNPHDFRDAEMVKSNRDGNQHPMLLVPLRDACKSTSDVATLIERSGLAPGGLGRGQTRFSVLKPAVRLLFPFLKRTRLGAID